MIGNTKIDDRRHLLSLTFLDRSLELAYRAAHNKKTLTQVRVALIIAAVLYGVFAIMDFLVIPEGRWNALMVRFGFAIPVFLLGFAATYKHYFRKRMQVMVMGIVYLAGLGVAIIALSYQDVRTDLHLTGTILPIFWAFLYSGLRFINAVRISIALIVTYDLIYLNFGQLPYEILVSYNFFLISSFLIGILGGYTIEQSFRRDFINQRIIKMNKQQNDRLLLNILPRFIAEELKTQPGTIARDYDQITVLFADLVGFSSMSINNSAHQVVEILNDIFSIFDKLTDKYHLEKIKTIGDAYMVTNNLQLPKESGVFEVAEFALEILDAIEDYNQRTGSNIRIRVGIHTGPAVAGVIGVKKFVYDVWGNTVNIASRMESECPINRIQVTQSSYELLQSAYEFEDRGKIEIKDHGNMQVYILNKRLMEVPKNSPVECEQHTL